MVDDDHLDPRGIGLGDRVERLRAAIDRYDKRAAACRDPHERLAGAGLLAQAAS